MAKGDNKGRKKRTVKKAAAPSVAKKKPAKKPAKPKIHSHPKLPGSWRLAWQALTIMKNFWRPLGGIMLIFAGLNLVLASGLGNIAGNFRSLTQDLDGSRLEQALIKFSSLTGGQGTGGSDASSAVSSMIFLVGSLAFIWALRQLMAGEAVRVKEAFYQGMTPLVPFVIILLVIILQLLPITITAAVLGIIITGAFGHAASIIFTILFLSAASWSLYMLAGSTMALYISTLPEMQPLKALRSARDLVRFRRWAIMRRLLMLPIILLLAFLLIFIPLLLIIPPLAAPLFFVAYVLAIFFAHSYLFNLYRWLLA